MPIPTTFVETAFMCFAVFAGFLLYAWLIGSFTTALAQKSAASRQESEQRDYINQYLQHKKIPNSLRRQVLEFYRFAGVDEQGPQALTSLPSSLVKQLQLFNNRALFLRIAFFKACDATELTRLVRRGLSDSWLSETFGNRGVLCFCQVPMLAREYVWPGNTVVQVSDVSGTQREHNEMRVGLQARYQSFSLCLACRRERLLEGFTWCPEGSSRARSRAPHALC